MAFNVKSGSFAINAGVGNQVIAGIGFEPKVVLFFPSVQTATGISAGAAASFGAAVSSTARFSITAVSRNGVTPSQANGGESAAHCITVRNPSAVGATLYQADFVSQNADGFTINVTTAPASNFMVGYLALGGDDLTNVYIGSDTLNTVLGNKSTVGVGFQPDALILAYGSFEFSLGFATATDEFGSSATSERAARNPSDVARWQETDQAIIGLLTNNAEDFQADLDSFDAGGFTLNYSDAAAAANPFYFVAIKANVSIKAGSFDSRAGAGNFSEIGIGFKPTAGIFSSVLAPTAAGRDLTDNKISIGAATGASDRVVIGQTREDGVAPTDTDNFFSDSLLYQNYDHAQNQLGAIDFVSWDADGFTFDQTDADPAANEIIYMLFEDAGGLVDANLELVRGNARVFDIVFPSAPIVSVFPNQRPVLASPGLAEYKVRLKNQSGEEVAEFDTWRGLNFVHKVNNLGTIRFEINGEDSRINLFELDGQIEVWRRNLIVDLPWYKEWEGFFRTSNDIFFDNDLNSFTAHGFSYLDLARRADIMYFDGSAGADKDGAGETVIKEYAAENIGPAALVTNGRLKSDGVKPGLTIQGNAGNGTNWQGAMSYKNLLKTIQDIAIKTGVDIDIVGTGAALTEFRVYDIQRGADRTKTNTDGNAPVIFSTDFGNMATPKLNKNRSKEVNAVYALGQGQADERKVALRETDAVNDSPWNRIEATKSIAQGDNADTTLEDGADEVLEDKKAQEKLDFQALQTPATYYGKHYTWGDRATAQFKDEEFDKKAVSASITVSEQVGGEQIDIKFADVPTL